MLYMPMSIFKNKKADVDKLIRYGFKPVSQLYTYHTDILDGQFDLKIDICLNGDMKTTVVDKDSNDIYILHLTDAAGEFVGKVRAEYLNTLQEIADTCFKTNIFKSPDTLKIIQYIQEKYQNELEFLWPKFPDNAIVRRKDNQKWYAAFLTVPKSKLGLKSEEPIEIIDLRGTPEQITALVDGKKYFPGFHMNKKHWLTICLDGSVSPEEIFNRIDASFELAKK